MQMPSLETLPLLAAELSHQMILLVPLWLKRPQESESSVAEGQVGQGSL